MISEHNPLDKLAHDDGLRARLAATASQDTFAPQPSLGLLARREAMRRIVDTITEAYWEEDDPFLYDVATGRIQDDIRRKIGSLGAAEAQDLGADFWTRGAIRRHAGRLRDRLNRYSDSVTETAVIPRVNEGASPEDPTVQFQLPPDDRSTVIMPRYRDGSVGPAALPSADRTELFVMPYDRRPDKSNK